MVAFIRKLGFLALLLALPPLVLTGCGAPTATLDLMTIARKGLAGARESQLAQHQEIMRHLQSQAAALDDAFDADVRLAAAGQIKDASGQPVAFTPQWVISSRRGYIAARDMVAKQMRQAETVHSIDADNLKAADEALDLASQLVLQQWNISERVKQQLINVQRRLINGR